MKILLGLLLSITFVFANESLNSLYENIILKDSKQTLVDIKKLTADIKNDNFDKVKKDFVALVKSWKSVEAFYILGDLDDNYLDTPRYLDMYHQGNEDIKAQLDLILKSDEDLKVALYKNSHKTINALEYILFTKDLKMKRTKEIALIITKKIQQNLQEIQDGYLKVKSILIEDEKLANYVIVNSLIENSYKLKEWRIGDTAGLSKKYLGKPDNRRAEYYLSQNSIIAIKAIIDAHLRILDKQEYENYGSLARTYGASDAIDEAVKHLKDAKFYALKIKNDDFNKSKDMYESLKKLYFIYYITLIDKLQVTSKILDADGD